MKFKFDKKYFCWGLTAFLVIVASILFYYILFHRSSLSNGIRTFISIAMPIIDGFVLAYLMTPILNKIEKCIIKPIYVKAKIPETPKSKRRMRGISILVTVVLILIVLYEFFGLIIPEVIRSIQSIIFQFPVYVNNLSNWALGLMKNNPELEEAVNGMISQYSSKILDYFNTNLLPHINDLIKTLSLSVIGIFRALWNFIIGFIGGKIVDSIIIGIICFACTSIIGTPYAILVSVIVGVTNVIPFFGPWIGGIPSALLVLMVDPLQALYFVILILFIQQFDGNILGPKILGDSTGLSGFWVIFSITIFGGLFGVLGMVVGVPIFAVFYAGVKALVNRSLSKKNLPTDVQPYMTVGQIEESRTFTEYVPPVKKKKKKEENSDHEVSDSKSKQR